MLRIGEEKAAKARLQPPSMALVSPTAPLLSCSAADQPPPVTDAPIACGRRPMTRC